MKINDNAKVIQGFCKDILKKCKEKKELNNKIKINNGLIKLMKAKFGKEYVFNKILSERNRNVFQKFNDDLKKHRLNTLKECFDKIKQNAFNNKLKNALNVQDNFKERIIKRTGHRQLCRWPAQCVFGFMPVSPPGRPLRPPRPANRASRRGWREAPPSAPRSAPARGS